MAALLIAFEIFTEKFKAMFSEADSCIAPLKFLLCENCQCSDRFCVSFVSGEIDSLTLVQGLSWENKDRLTPNMTSDLLNRL